MQPAEITLAIRMLPGQQPQVTGPLQDKMLCYALLEVARDVIKDYQGPPLIEVPRIHVDLGNGKRP